MLTKVIGDTVLLPFLHGTALDSKLLNLGWRFSIPGILGELRPLVVGDVVILTEPPVWVGQTALRRGDQAGPWSTLGEEPQATPGSPVCGFVWQCP